jgi:hypothetical protein
MSTTLPELKSQKKTPYWLPIVAIALLLSLGLNTFALLRSGSKETKYLIQTEVGKIYTAEPGKKSEIVIKNFIRDLVTLTFAYSEQKDQDLKKELGKEPRMMFYGKYEIWLPNAMATYGMNSKLQQAIIKGLATEYYPRIKSFGAKEVTLRPDVITTPRKISPGMWRLYLTSNRFYFDAEGRQMAKDAYNAIIIVREVDPPMNPLGAVSQYDDLVYQSRQSGLEIYDLKVLDNPANMADLIEKDRGMP